MKIYNIVILKCILYVVSLNFKMKLTLVHENQSNGTAYDIAVALYMPPTVTYVTSSKRYIDVVKKANQIEDGRTLYFEVE